MADPSVVKVRTCIVDMMAGQCDLNPTCGVATTWPALNRALYDGTTKHQLLVVLRGRGEAYAPAEETRNPKGPFVDKMIELAKADQGVS